MNRIFQGPKKLMAQTFSSVPNSQMTQKAKALYEDISALHADFSGLVGISRTEMQVVVGGAQQCSTHYLETLDGKSRPDDINLSA